MLQQMIILDGDDAGWEKEKANENEDENDTEAKLWAIN